MSTVLWILGALSLLGGFVLSFTVESGVWLAAGFVSFVVFGGFATIISLLGEIRDGIKLSNERLSELIQKQNTTPLSPEERRKKEAEEAKRLEEQRKKEAEEAKLADEKRRKEEAAKRVEEKRRKEEEVKRAEEKRRKEEAAKRAEEKRKKKEVAESHEELKAIDEKALWDAAEEERLSKFHVVGEEVIFGKYPQEGQEDNADVEWVVLDTDKNQTLLLSKKALDAQQFNKEGVSTSWEACDIRKWLNNSFFENAFSKSEQKAICQTQLTDESTEDRVFLLSQAEAKEYFTFNHKRTCQITPYAEGNGAYCNNIGKGWWWLRSTQNEKAFCVDTDGKIKSIDADNSDCATRPAIWVNTELLPREE